MTRQDVINALRDGRRRQLMHGHDWDVVDVLEVLDDLKLLDNLDGVPLR